MMASNLNNLNNNNTLSISSSQSESQESKSSIESFNSDSQPYNQKTSSKKKLLNNYLKISEQCPEVSNPIVTDQVISVETLTAHLNLLIRFTSINCNDQNLFLRYLARAEHRYIIWLNLLDHYRPPIESMPIPPLDVALFWCAHATNLLAYQEDVIRLYGEHMLIYNFPLLQMDMKDKEGDEYVDMNSLKTWKSFSDDEPYLLEFDDDRPFLITCPFCIKDNSIDPDLYVQLKMNASTHTCQNCSLQLNADILSAKRLLNDINQFLSDNTKCLAGTLLDTEKNQIDSYTAVSDNILLFDQDVIRELIRLSSPAYTGKPSPPSLYIPNITKNCNWQIIQQEFSTILHQLDSQGDLRYVRKNILDQVISAYQNLLCPFSLDLMAAVIRYQETVDKILCAGDWSDESIIALATVRYHKFLILTQKYPDRLLVPTMDILLCWYTHTLWPSRYYSFTIELIGKIWNYENSLSESKMADNLAKTALLWHKKFNEPYTSDDPSRKWKKSSRVVMSVVFPVYGLYVAQRLWKLGKTRDKKIGPGGTINKSSWVTSNSCDINSNERRGPYNSGVNFADSELMSYQDSIYHSPTSSQSSSSHSSRVFSYVPPKNIKSK
ncbi:hypothetical protein Glove_134g250 [Diversispora epigaea]|uniref:Uncharacterized protein n=1 Tax=Diversispora epigaea TaxID=1348612 RepID=A0A397J1S7_9GLOM|nr:hypothetical protein Glove_134g250 [Diversispora epigaea]